MEERLKINLIDAITDFADKFDESPPSEEDDTSKADTSLTSALSTITGNTNKQTDKMVQMFDALIKKVERLETKCGVASNSGDDTSSTDKINPRTGRPYRRYCWTCGCCDHWGRTCPVRKPGHKINATFKNRMGGSTKGVLGA